MPSGWPQAAPHPSLEIEPTMTNAFTPIEILRPTILEFGNGTITAAARFAERIGAKRPLVVSDPFNARRVEMIDVAWRCVGNPAGDVADERAGWQSVEVGDGDRALRRRTLIRPPQRLPAHSRAGRRLHA
jgi:hypothetical protein